MLSLRDRSVWRLGDAHRMTAGPEVWLLADAELGGVLVNAPVWSPALVQATSRIAPLRYVFLPSHRGARDLDRWRAAGCEVLAFEAEAPAIRAEQGADAVDIAFNRKQRLSRTIDFLPMAGVTAGTCALRCKNLPGVVFFGPALAPGEDGWPTVRPAPEDHSAEARLFGCLGVKDLKFEWAFCDAFDPETTRVGPEADRAICAAIGRFLDD
ncbi:MAG: hypothetical protein ACK4IT_10450 [Thioalkalivibrionaceae bacterium]